MTLAGCSELQGFFSIKMHLKLTNGDIVFWAREYRIRGQEIADETPSQAVPNLLDLGALSRGAPT
jgi:hypothetical protein